MNTKEMHDVLARSQEGKLTFPEVVGRLLAANVESYFCDLAAGSETFYTRDGQVYAEKMILSLAPSAEDFSGADVVAAIRGAQADTVRYPEFVKRVTAAGVIAYWAFLTGKKVIYFGRKGEQHIEEFPKPKS